MKFTVIVWIRDNAVNFELSEAVDCFSLPLDEAQAFAESISNAVKMASLHPSTYDEFKQAAQQINPESDCRMACAVCGKDTGGEVEEEDGDSLPLCFSCYEQQSLDAFKIFIDNVRLNYPDVPMIQLNSEFPIPEAPANGLVCPVCGEPQFIAPRGVFCINLHEGKGVFCESKKK